MENRIDDLDGMTVPALLAELQSLELSSKRKFNAGRIHRIKELIVEKSKKNGVR